MVVTALASVLCGPEAGFVDGRMTVSFSAASEVVVGRCCRCGTDEEILH